MYLLLIKQFNEPVKLCNLDRNYYFVSEYKTERTNKRPSHRANAFEVGFSHYRSMYIYNILISYVKTNILQKLIN
jgi:hypothetical protein